MNHSHIALCILGLQLLIDYKDYKVRFERQFHYSYKHNKRVFIQGSWSNLKWEDGLSGQGICPLDQLVNISENIPLPSVCVVVLVNTPLAVERGLYNFLIILSLFFFCENISCCKLTPFKLRETHRPYGPISSWTSCYAVFFLELMLCTECEVCR